MTQLLARAFTEASRLPDLQQNRLPRWLIDELSAERKWDSLFAESEDLLAGLADEALKAHHAGKSRGENRALGFQGIVISHITGKFRELYSFSQNRILAVFDFGGTSMCHKILHFVQKSR